MATSVCFWSTYGLLVLVVPRGSKMSSFSFVAYNTGGGVQGERVKFKARKLRPEFQQKKAEGGGDWKAA